MSAFAKGLQAGSETARGWIDAYESSRKRREEEELRGGLRRAGQLEPETIYTPRAATPNELARAQAETSRLAAQDAATFGLGTEAEIEAYAPPYASTNAPVTDPTQYRLGGLTREKPFTQDEIQRARTEAIAQEYERQGRPEEAMRMRSLAQQQEAAQLQTQQVRTQLQQSETNRAASQQLSERYATGEVVPVSDILKIASETGADPGVLMQVAASNLDLTTRQTKVMTEKLIQDIRNASTNPDRFRQLLDKVADPDPTDNISPELRKVGKGYQIFYGDQPLSPAFQDTKEMNALAQMAEYYVGQISGNPTGMAVNLATLNKIRAQTTESEAKAAQAQAYAEWIRSGRPGTDTGRLAQTLNDQEKIAYQEAIKAIANLGPDATSQQIAAVYRNFGLDPAKFGVQGMPGWRETVPGGLEPSAGGLTRRIPGPDVTARGAARGQQTPVNTKNFIRERQKDGTYLMRDLVTNKTYSITEYNRLLEGQ